MENTEYFDNYEDRLTEMLVGYCMGKGYIDDMLISVEELDEKWVEAAPEYLADAVPNFNEYPTVAVAWAGYYGMALASIWDADWGQYASVTGLYKMISEPRTFDAMDEYIVEDVLGMDLEGDEAKKIEDLLRSCAQMAVSMMKKESVEPMSVGAFHIFARTVRVLYKIGVSIELKRLGYMYSLANSNDLAN